MLFRVAALPGLTLHCSYLIDHSAIPTILVRLSPVIACVTQLAHAANCDIV